ncbi:MAG: phospho-sugar mutase [Tissierellia bacterium]|nr:phospho-sugar mutase [Bacillota bacterium]NLL23015.1 phospho-sugar mutase [Tissierellia bacterium]
MMDIKAMVEAQLLDPKYDEEYKAQLKALSEEEARECFYKELSFGTAGIRGKLGVGPNRMHKYLVRSVSYAYALYLKEQQEEPSAVIAYDSRNGSPEFAQEAARTLASNDVKTYLFDQYASTPELSFAVRYLDATGGIVITASHNPPEYNGYKVYHRSGRQLLQEEAGDILRLVEENKEKTDIPFRTAEELIEEGRLEMIGDNILGAYDGVILAAVKNPACRDMASQLRIVYTPLHGVGWRAMHSFAQNFGLTKLYPVESQMHPDGSFPEARQPNPENPEVFEKAIAIAEEKGADLILATDPDVDRIGAMVRGDDGFEMIDGNQMGALMAEYLFSLRQGQGGTVITSVVSTSLVDAIASTYKGRVLRTLTGFKYIGEAMDTLCDNEFVLGFEESYGYLSGLHARDKDAINAAALIIEMALSALSQGKSLLDKQREIEEKYGYYKEGQIVLTLEGEEGAQKIRSLMAGFRDSPLEKVATGRRTELTDYLEDTDLPKEDVIKWNFRGDQWVAIRPSGTEPKLKIYLGSHGQSANDVRNNYRDLENSMKALLEKE